MPLPRVLGEAHEAEAVDLARMRPQHRVVQVNVSTGQQLQEKRGLPMSHPPNRGVSISTNDDPEIIILTVIVLQRAAFMPNANR